MDERHYIFGTEADQTTQTKEVKMRLPISHLIRLHGLKLLTGQNISDTVTQALEQYFQEAEDKKAQKQAEQAAVSAQAVAESEP